MSETHVRQIRYSHYFQSSLYRVDFAKRSFRCAAPSVWNSLPVSVIGSELPSVFKSMLKTFLFRRSFSKHVQTTAASASEVTTLWRFTNMLIIISSSSIVPKEDAPQECRIRREEEDEKAGSEKNSKSAAVIILSAFVRQFSYLGHRRSSGVLRVERGRAWAAESAN